MACAECPACLIDQLPEGSPQAAHELHITIAESRPSRLSEFRTFCDGIGVRAHAMEILIDPDTSLFEMMTGSSIQGSDAAAVRELCRLGDLLAEGGWDPVRVKIESVPWHPRAPQKTGDPAPDGSYWESHIGLWIEQWELSAALTAIESWGGYLSLNRGKPQRSAAQRIQYRASATLRGVGIGRVEQEARASRMRQDLRALVRDVDTSVRTEFTWLDLAEDSARVGGPPVLAAA